MRAFVAIALVALLAAPAEAYNYRTSAGGTTQHRGMCGKAATGYAVSAVPTAITAWWNADDTASITESSGAVSAWVDQTATYTVSQATAGAKPTLVASGSGTLGGAQHLSFDGGDFLSIDSPLFSGSLGEVWATVDTDTTTGLQAVYGQANNSTSVYNILYVVGATVTKFSLATSANNNVVRVTNAIAANTSYVLCWQSTDTAYVMSKNGVAETNVVASGADNGNWFADSTGVRSAIGSYYHNTTTQFLAGQLHDVVVVDGANLITADATALRAYLSGAVGVSFP